MKRDDKDQQRARKNFWCKVSYHPENTKNPASVGRRGGIETTTRDMSSLLTDMRTGNAVYALPAAPLMQNSSLYAETAFFG